MVIANGTIAAKIKTGGRLGTDGYPVKPDEAWGHPIPCHVKVNKKNNLGKQNENTFKIASYEVLVELNDYSDLILCTEDDYCLLDNCRSLIDLTNGVNLLKDEERIRLSLHESDLGEFSVMWTECLDAVGALKIVV